MTKIIILIDKDAQDMESGYPYFRLLEEGYDVKTAAPSKEFVRCKYGYYIKPHITFKQALTQVKKGVIDAIIIPGGWAPDYMRLNKDVLSIVQQMDKKKKIIGAICHAGWVLSSAKVLKGRKVTSYKAIKDDVENAGAKWVDKEVVIDGNLITSRTPNDLPIFCKTIIKELKKK